MLATAEGLIGQLYPAILIATLPGMALQARLNLALKEDWDQKPSWVREAKGYSPRQPLPCASRISVTAQFRVWASDSLARRKIGKPEQAEDRQNVKQPVLAL